MIGGAQNSVNRRLLESVDFRNRNSEVRSRVFTMRLETNSSTAAAGGNAPFDPLDDVQLQSSKVFFGSEPHCTSQQLAGIAQSPSHVGRDAHPCDERVENALVAETSMNARGFDDSEEILEQFGSKIDQDGQLLTPLRSRCSGPDNVAFQRRPVNDSEIFCIQKIWKHSSSADIWPK